MGSHFISILLGFIEGFALIISPCILPILPVFIAGALTGSRKRPLGMVIGFILFFTVLVFFSRQLVSYLGINFNLMRNIGYVLLAFLGVVMFSNYLTEKFTQLTQSVARIGTTFFSISQRSDGFFNGLFLGALIALVWTPCAGPILAAIIVQTVVQKTTIISFFTLVAFALGAVIPMLIISVYGKKIISALTFFKVNPTFFRKFLGIILIVNVIYMVYFAEVSALPAKAQSGIKISTSLIGGLWRPYAAPPIQGIDAWINSPPLRLNDLRGKVVLIDFWTYSCINCLRTLPYVKDWYHNYHDKGLVIIGVHTPEFAFEKNLANVRAAVQSNGILYPVALDNQFVTWINFNNHYWPAHYLINKSGEVVYQHFGEGEYDTTENNIRFLLGIKELNLATPTHNEPVFFSQTPETYLGYERANVDLSPGLIKDKVAPYHFSANLPLNTWSLEGLWQVQSDAIIAAEANAALKIHFNAAKVFAVMGPGKTKPSHVHVRLNGREIKNIIVDKYSIYELLAQQKFSQGDLEIIVKEPGIKIYTFTFGS